MSQDHEPDSAIGTVTHYFGHLSVAALTLNDILRTGDRIHVRGHTTDLEQTVESMEVDHAKVDQAGPGDDVALRVAGHVREHDHVFREG